MKINKKLLDLRTVSHKNTAEDDIIIIYTLQIVYKHSVQTQNYNIISNLDHEVAVNCLNGSRNMIISLQIMFSTSL